MTRNDAPGGHVGGRIPRAAALLVALALALAGCASGGGGSEQESSPRADGFDRGSYHDNPLRVRVENQNWRTISVRVVAGGQVDFLGQLASQQTRTYEVPASVMGSREEIRLLADPVGGSQGTLTDPILVQPGDLVEWTLTQPLIHSHIFVK